MKLAASIANREAPVDGLVPGITLGNVGVDASSQSCLVGNATGKTGTRQNGEFHFSHVEPTAMLWGVVELQLSGDGAGLFGRECLVERRWLVRVEIVQHDTDDVGVGLHIDDMLHDLGKLNLGPPLGDQHLAQASLGSLIIIRSRTPLRLYSTSKHSGRPGAAGIRSRTSAINCLGLSSKHTIGRFSS